MAQKRADFRNDVLLTAYLEPLAAWLGLLGGDPGCDVLEHAWRVVLQSHPHDSICGCSVDPVHDEIDVRLARRADRARPPRRGGGSLWIACARRAGTGRRRARPRLNPHGPGRGAVDAELELDLPSHAGASRRPLRDAAGRRVLAAADLVDAGTTLADLRPSARARRT
jgi:hypothetical protein